MPQGTIKKLVMDKGFGFIQGERGDLFFHHSALDGTSIEELREGQQVEFRGRPRAKRTPRRKREARRLIFSSPIGRRQIIRPSESRFSGGHSSVR